MSEHFFVAQDAPGTRESQNSTRRLLITGATGMIGHALIARARAVGWEAVPVKRPQEGAKDGSDAGSITWQPEAAQPFADLEQLEGFDAAVHLSGANLNAKRWTPAYRKTILESRTLTTGALALALARLRNPPKVLLTASATGFYGSRGDEVLTEQSAKGTGFLSEVCELWENAASPALAASIRVVHARFGVVLTPFGGALKQMLPLFQAGVGGRLGSGHQWMSWIALDDLLEGILFDLDHDGITGPVNMVSPQPIRNSTFTAALGKALNRPAILPAPAFALRAAFGEMADETLLASCRAIPDKLSAAGFTFQMPAIDDALTQLLARNGGA